MIPKEPLCQKRHNNHGGYNPVNNLFWAFLLWSAWFKIAKQRPYVRLLRVIFAWTLRLSGAQFVVIIPSGIIATKVLPTTLELSFNFKFSLKNCECLYAPAGCRFHVICSPLIYTTTQNRNLEVQSDSNTTHSATLYCAQCISWSVMKSSDDFQEEFRLSGLNVLINPRAVLRFLSRWFLYYWRPKGGSEFEVKTACCGETIQACFGILSWKSFLFSLTQGFELVSEPIAEC